MWIYSLVTFTCVLKNQSRVLGNFKKTHKYLSNICSVLLMCESSQVMLHQQLCMRRCAFQSEYKWRIRQSEKEIKCVFWKGVLVRNHCLFQSRQPANLFSPPTVSLPLDCFNKKLWIRRWWVAVPWCSLLKLGTNTQLVHPPPLWILSITLHILCVYVKNVIPIW